MMWEVSTAAISRKRKMSSIASAVLRVAEAVVLVLVDVSMSLVRRSGCVKVDVSWDFARFTVGFANGCNAYRRIVKGPPKKVLPPRPCEHGLRRCQDVGQE
jgi:hypothetical protein